MDTNSIFSKELLNIQAFVAMHADAVREYIQIFKTNNQNVSKDILDDVQKIYGAAEQLKKQLELIKELNLLDTDLKQSLSTLRHELRSPVNGIKGYSELVLEKLEETHQNQLNGCFVIIIEIVRQILLLIDRIQLATQGENIAPDGKNAGFHQETAEENHPLQALTEGSLVLVVDDIDTNRELLKEWLTRKNYRVMMAEGGQVALNLLGQNKSIDIILLDLNMPGMDGFEVLQKIKLSENYSHIPVIMISAADEIDGIVRCIKIGAEDYLSKPFNSFLLDARIIACIERKRLRDREKAYMLRITEEMNIAQGIQLSMLPNRFPNEKSFSIFGQSIPAKEVGGDFYDFYLLSKTKVGFCIGDVSGKGIPAALFMAVSRTVLYTLSTLSTHPSEYMQKTNTILLKDNDAMLFVTVFFAVLDIETGQLSYVNGGHLPAIVVRKNGEIEKLSGVGGPALGVIQEAQFSEHTTFLKPGDLILLYTDGVSEAMNVQNVEFGVERLTELLKTNKQSDPKLLIQDIIKNIKEYAGAKEQSDDITCLSLVYDGQSPDENKTLGNNVYTINLSDDLSELSELERGVKYFCEQNTLEQNICYYINLVCEEVFVNVLTHGKRPNIPVKVTIDLAKTNNIVTITIKDNGVFFDPLQKNIEDINVNIQSTPGGFGIYLMRTWATSMQYFRQGEENVSVIKKVIESS